MSEAYSAHGFVALISYSSDSAPQHTNPRSTHPSQSSSSSSSLETKLSTGPDRKMAGLGSGGTPRPNEICVPRPAIRLRALTCEHKQPGHSIRMQRTRERAGAHTCVTMTETGAFFPVPVPLPPSLFLTLLPLLLWPQPRSTPDGDPKPLPFSTAAAGRILPDAAARRLGPR